MNQRTGAPAGCPVDELFDPLAADFLADPFAALAQLPPTAERPVFFAPSIGYYIVTRYTDIEQVFRDHGTFSAAVAQAPLVPVVPEAQQALLGGASTPQPPSMVSLDEPAHARLRKPAARAFSMKRVQAMVPTIRDTTVRLLDAVGDTGQFDLVPALAFPLPANIVFSLMGVPEHDYGQHREEPDRLTLDEIGSILFSLSFAGHETTTGLIGNAVRRLLEDPARWAAILADPGLIPAAVEETLRFDPSVPVWRRVTTRPAMVGGVELPAGARLFLWLAAAGRDDAAFRSPDVFDLHRPNSDQHLAFGQGLHYCLGANLGKLEAEIAIGELVRRYPRLALAAGQELTFHPNISFRGPQSLVVEAAVQPSRGLD